MALASNYSCYLEHTFVQYQLQNMTYNRDCQILLNLLNFLKQSWIYTETVKFQGNFFTGSVSARMNETRDRALTKTNQNVSTLHMYEYIGL